ncbi:P-loop containing nucleoside triphosphate hydrolase [Cinara cedri]|uniref:P-loop containing nucleoside triphosphate hydrolase n=1 Tax=Cinara cedri TaxID=506608 RepID=A0A5E4NES9_9HEMI|nr:P-loop containing nucleoside triphosphate hydrolase [Cinara cedri]
MPKEHNKLEKILDKYKNIEPFPYQETKDNDESIFPIPLRCLIVGSSGSGKSNLLWNIITNFRVPFENLYISTKTIDQPIYEKLVEEFNDIDEIETVISNEGIVSVDECQHKESRHKADLILEKNAKDIYKNPETSLGEKTAAFATSNIMKVKRKLRMGLI